MTQNMKLQAFKAAFPNTIPILAGFLFLGISYGAYARMSGFSLIYPVLMTVMIYGGSLEFVTVALLLSPFAPIQALCMALMIQARHLFYGMALLEKYKNLGWKKYYIIYALADETFAVNFSAKVPEHVDRGWFYFFVSILHQSYWITGSIIGSLLGTLIPSDFKGIDFVMTAMFVVIFVDHLMKTKDYYTAVIGVVCAALCLHFFGSTSFMIPTMICILACLTLLRKPLEKASERASEKAGEKT